MTRCEQDKLCAVVQHQPENSVFFRDLNPPFGKGRVSNRTEDGLVVANSVTPRQSLFTFDMNKPERESRIVLGWESMLLCGFPADVIGKMDRGKDPPFPDKSLQILAAHMLPVPVFMAIFLATLASVPWSYADDGDESDTEATLKHGMEEPDNIFARL